MSNAAGLPADDRLTQMKLECTPLPGQAAAPFSTVSAAINATATLIPALS